MDSSSRLEPGRPEDSAHGTRVGRAQHAMGVASELFDEQKMKSGSFVARSGRKGLFTRQASAEHAKGGVPSDAITFVTSP